MKTLNQLDGATGDFLMEDDSDDAPLSLNSPGSGSFTPPHCTLPIRFVNFVRSLKRLIMMSARAMTQWEFRVGELMLMG